MVPETGFLLTFRGKLAATDQIILAMLIQMNSSSDQISQGKSGPVGFFVSLPPDRPGKEENQMSTETPLDSEERIVEIEMERLRDFKNHPFKITEDNQMKALMESIQKYGILNPIIVRPRPEGIYEIISGHRRKYAAKLLGYRKIPVVIRMMTNEEAVIYMVDSNMHREKILPSEKAFAFKMKYQAILEARKNGREGHDVHPNLLSSGKSLKILSKETGESEKQIQRYVKVTQLIPELLEMLDKGEISFTPACEIAFLTNREQKMLIDAMAYVQSSPSVSQAQRMKKLSQAGELTLQEMKDILTEVKKVEINRVDFKNVQLHQFFPKEYTAKQMKREILKILNQWKKQKEKSAQKYERRKKHV